MKDKLIVALDVDDLKKAKALVDKLYPVVKIFKVGSELFTACGPSAVEMIHKKGAQVFLDLKFHDIPNTVARAIKTAKKTGVYMLNVHASGGKEMLRAASKAKGKDKRPLLLAVTVLTSLDTEGLKGIGVKRSAIAQVKSLARAAKRAGLDGIVCSAKEIKAIRKTCGKKFTIITPGIRPVGSLIEDQRRIATPERAIQEGADYIVVGRPITHAKDPLAEAKKITQKI